MLSKKTAVHYRDATIESKRAMPRINVAGLALPRINIARTDLQNIFSTALTETDIESRVGSRAQDNEPSFLFGRFGIFLASCRYGGTKPVEGNRQQHVISVLLMGGIP
jgi:hypothetical protein